MVVLARWCLFFLMSFSHRYMVRWEDLFQKSAPYGCTRIQYVAVSREDDDDGPER